MPQNPFEEFMRQQAQPVNEFDSFVQKEAKPKPVKPTQPKPVQKVQTRGPVRPQGPAPTFDTDPTQQMMKDLAGRPITQQAPSPAPVGGIQEAFSNIGRSIVQGGTSVVRDIVRRSNQPLPGTRADNPINQMRPRYDAARVEPQLKQVEQRAQEALPVNPDTQDSYNPLKSGFWRKTLPAGVGSTVLPMAAGMLTRGRFGAGSGVGIVGSMQNSAQTYDEALAATGDLKKAAEAADIGAAIGALEQFGLGRTIEKLGLTRPIARRLAEMGKESVQESVTRLANNVNAKIGSGYDPERAIMEGVAEEGWLGFLIGSGVQAADAAVSPVFRGAQTAINAPAVRAIEQERGAPLNLTASRPGGAPTTVIPLNPTPEQAAQFEGAKGSILRSAERDAAEAQIDEILSLPAEEQRAAIDALPEDPLIYDVIMSRVQQEVADIQADPSLTPIQKAQQVANLRESLGQEGIDLAPNIPAQGTPLQDRMRAGRPGGPVEAPSAPQGPTPEQQTAEVLNRQLGDEQIQVEQAKAQLARQREAQRQQSIAQAEMLNRQLAKETEVERVARENEQAFEQGFAEALDYEKQARDLTALAQWNEALVALAEQKGTLTALWSNLPREMKTPARKRQIDGELERIRQNRMELLRAQRRPTSRQDAKFVPQFMMAEQQKRVDPVETGEAFPDLLQTVRRLGGIKTEGATYGGEIAGILSNKESGTTGLVNNRSGMDLDYMREALVGEGAIPPETTNSELLEMLDMAVRNKDKERPAGTIDEQLAAYWDEMGRAEAAPVNEFDEFARSAEETPPRAVSEETASPIPADAQDWTRRNAEATQASEDRRPPMGLGAERSNPARSDVSFSPYNDLVQNNKELIEQLYNLPLDDAETANVTLEEGLAKIQEFADRRGIEQRHVDALEAYIRSRHFERVANEASDPGFAGWVDEKTAEIRAAIPKIADDIEAEIERQVAALDAFYADETAVNLFNKARAGNNADLRALMEYAENEYGINGQDLAETVRRYREIDEEAKQRTVAAKSRIVKSDIQRRVDETPFEDVEAEVSELLRQPLDGLTPADIDPYLETLEAWRNRSITRDDIPAHLLKPLRTRMADVSELRHAMVKDKLIGPKFESRTFNKAQTAERIEQRQKKREERRQAQREVRQRQRERGETPKPYANQQAGLDALSDKPFPDLEFRHRFGLNQAAIDDMIDEGWMREVEGGFVKAEDKAAAPAEAPLVKPQPKASETYFRGDKARYTGNTIDVDGQTLYEIEVLEGHRTGQRLHTSTTPEGGNPNVERQRREFREEQEGWKRLRETERSRQPKQSEPKPSSAVNRKVATKKKEDLKQPDWIGKRLVSDEDRAGIEAARQELRDIINDKVAFNTPAEKASAILSGRERIQELEALSHAKAAARRRAAEDEPFPQLTKPVNMPMPEPEPEGRRKKTPAAEPQTVTHPDPAINGKPIIAETSDGKVVVANPENKSGVSVVKDRGEGAGIPHNPAFRSWRVQGTTVRHAQPGKRITADRSVDVLNSLKEFNLSGVYDEAKGVVRVQRRTGAVSDFEKDLRSVWHKYGSPSVHEIRQSEAQAKTKAAVQDRQEGYQSFLKDNQTITDWIDTHFGPDVFNAFNKSAMVRFLSGQDSAFQGQLSPKAQDGFERAGAIVETDAGLAPSFDALKRFFESNKPTGTVKSALSDEGITGFDVGGSASRLAPITQAFKRWFRGSVITDTGKPGGKPQRMYHATGRDFDTFRRGRHRGAIFFSATPDGAIEGATASTREGMNSGVNQIMPVYLRVERLYGRSYSLPKGIPNVAGARVPYMNDAAAQRIQRRVKAAIDRAKFSDNAAVNDYAKKLAWEEWQAFHHWEDGTPETGSRLVRTDEPMAYRGGKYQPIDKRDRAMAWEVFEKGPSYSDHDNIGQRAIELLGYDGAMISDEGAETIAVFKDTQIKSAIGNRGTYDDNEGSILKMRTPQPPNYRPVNFEEEGGKSQKVKTKKTTPPPHLLTENEFRSKYWGHMDLRSKTQEERDATRRSIQSNGFRRAFNVNAASIPGKGDKGWEARFFRPKVGTDVYLIPSEFIEHGKNGARIKEGFKPADDQIIQITREGQSVHEAVIEQAVKRGLDVPQGILDRYPDIKKPRTRADVENSPEFKRWTRGAEVVKDATKHAFESGKAVVVRAFHGTKFDFDTFSTLFGGRNTEAPSARRAFFFTDDAETATDYASIGDGRTVALLKEKAERLERTAQRSGRQSDWTAYENAYAAYETASLSQDFVGDYVEGTNVIPAYISMQNPLVRDFGGERYREESFYDLLDEARKSGHDGVVFTNVFDPGNESNAKPINVFAVFKSAQIKSYTGNRGTYSDNEGSILKTKQLPFLESAPLPKGEITEEQKLDLLREIDGEFRTRKRGQGTLYINNQTSLALDKIEKDIIGKTGPASPFGGEVIPIERAEEIFDVVDDRVDFWRGKGEAKIAKAFGNLAKLLREAIDDATANGANSIEIVNAQSDASLKEPELYSSKLDWQKKVKRHEALHSWQGLVNPNRLGLLSNAQISQDPYFERIYDKLRDYYDNITKDQVWAEAVAFIGSGDWASLGLSKAEAVDFLDRFFTMVAKEHGRSALNGLRLAHPTTRGIIEEVRRRSAEGTGRAAGVAGQVSQGNDARRESSRIELRGFKERVAEERRRSREAKSGDSRSAGRDRGGEGRGVKPPKPPNAPKETAPAPGGKKPTGDTAIDAINAAKEAEREKRNKPAAKPIRVVGELYHASRTILASSDLSALRQGMFMSLPPSQWPKAWRAMRTMFGSLKRSNYEGFKAGLEAHPDYKAAQEAGLFFATADADKMTDREEAFISEWASNLPIVKQSEQAFKSYLDSLRIDTFAKYKRALDSRLAGGAITDVQYGQALREAAYWINTSTGRGSVRGKVGDTINTAMPVASAALFAPRYLISRFQLLNPITYGRNVTDAGKRVIFRNQMAEMFQSAAVLTAIGYGASLLGATVNWDDPDDPDWLKIKFGNTRFDALAGVQQVARLGVRIGKWLKTEATEDDLKTLRDMRGSTKNRLLTFGRTKLAPVPSFFVDWINDWKNVIGEQRKPFEFMKKEGAAAKFEEASKDPIISRYLPLLWSDMVEAYVRGYREGGATVGAKQAAKFSPAIFGIGVQDYERKPNILSVGETSAPLAESLQKLGLKFESVRSMPGESPEQLRERAQKINVWMDAYGEALVKNPRFRKLTPEQQKAAIENLRGRVGGEANRKTPRLSRFNAASVIAGTLKGAEQKRKRAAGNIYNPPE